jgi:hypothetical protein
MNPLNLPKQVNAFNVYHPIYNTDPRSRIDPYMAQQEKMTNGYKKGGIVKKTGVAKVHKGELVIPKNLVKYVSKTLKDKIKKGGGNV